MVSIVDNLQKSEKVTYEGVRAKPLHISANKSVTGSNKVAYRVQSLETHLRNPALKKRVAPGSERGRCGLKGTHGTSAGS